MLSGLRTRLVAAAALVIACASAALLWFVVSERSTDRGRVLSGMAVSVPLAPKGGPFGTSSVWRTPVTGAPVAPESPALVAKLVGQVQGHWGGVAAFNVSKYNTSFYSVDADEPRHDIKFTDCQGKGHVPRGLYGPGGQFTAVPVPEGATPANGTDANLTIYQASTDTIWELWMARKQADGWYACWGGRMRGVSKNPGYFTDYFGATASGLSSIGGAVGVREAQAGSIDHALSLQVLDAANGGRVSWPAQRSDGADGSADAIPMGTRFRLDPAVDVDALQLHPLAAMVAKAAQRYGFIVSDRSGAVAVVTESGEPVRRATGVDPWPALMKGAPSYEVLRGFPWDRLQALPRDLGKPVTP